ncbi:hypothetical protein HIM_07337 [Hirsutella minnesotensis 3608]|uniref:BTB domain-containing protein n=1 Tax=Hirsutella minnesotensis 3608 TaxID=1043627 RepID=A0A0F7ZTL7_9HYPO|nr:hypothetical protein HIM_07337 [Hirsutella minnesotensis 3608]
MSNTNNKGLSKSRKRALSEATDKTIVNKAPRMDAGEYNRARDADDAVMFYEEHFETDPEVNCVFNCKVNGKVNCAVKGEEGSESPPIELEGGNEDHNTHVRQVTTVASLGDLMLVVGPANVRIQVNSLILREASPVLNARICKRSKIKLVASKGGPVLLFLRDDDATAMELLCRILHCDPSMSTVPEASEILQLVKVARKYEVLDRVGFIVEVWIQHLYGVDDIDELWALLCAANIIQSYSTFENLSRRLIIKHQGSYRPFAAEDKDNAVAWQLASALEEGRSTLRALLGVLIFGKLQSALQDYPFCACGVRSRMISHWVEHVHPVASTWCLHEHSIENVFGKLQRISEARPLCHQGIVHSPSSIPSYVIQEVDGLLGRCRGLCLGCFNENKITIGRCRHRSPGGIILYQAYPSDDEICS